MTGKNYQERTKGINRVMEEWMAHATLAVRPQIKFEFRTEVDCAAGDCKS